MNDKEFVGAYEAAKLIGVSYNTIYNYTKQNKLTAYKSASGRAVYSVDEVKKLFKPKEICRDILIETK